MLKNTWLLVVMLMAHGLFAQMCQVDKTLSEITSLNATGNFSEALEKAEKLLGCKGLTKEQQIQSWIWQFKLNRNQLKEKEANQAILMAKELLEAKGESLSFDFRLLLVESSALRKDTTVYNKLLRQVKDEIFSREPEDHLSKGRYYFLINYTGNELVPNLLKAIQHFEQLDSIPQFHMGATLRSLGNKHRDMGDLDKSVAYYQRELDIYKAYFPSTHFNLSICNFNLGNVYYDRLEYQLALDHYLKTHPVWERYFEPDHFRMKTLNEAIGDMYWELGDQTNALAYFDKATLNEVAVNNDVSEQTISNADSLLEKGNYGTAINYYREAVQWREKTYGKQHTLTAACKNFVGRAMRSSGDLEGSLNTYQEAITILVPQLKDTSQLANPTMKMRIQSEQYLLEALIAKGTILKELYDRDQKVAQLETALETQEVAISVLEKIKNTQISETSKVFWAARTRSLIESAIGTAVSLYEVKKDPKYLKQAFSFSERSKAILLLTSLFDQEISLFSKVPAAVISEEKELKNTINEFSGRINSEEKRCGEVRRALLQVYKNELLSAQNKYDLFLRDLNDNYPEYYQLKYDPEIATVEMLQSKLLDEDTALVSYFAGENHLFVFFITELNIAVRKVSNASKILGEAEQLFAQISNRNELLKQPQQAYLQFGALSHSLYKTLLQPELSAATHSRLILIPDGNLSYLPFEMLITEPASPTRNYRALSYLLRRSAVSYSPSASIALLSTDRVNNNDNYLGFAPNYENQVYGDLRKELTNLRYNSSEVDYATKLFNGNSWTGQGVSEQLMKEQSGKAGILHLAMHGEVEDEHPLLSKLYFNPSENEDGILHTYEIYGLEIPSQLVILSACNTASGKLEGGEGILSLERAFQYAGSQSMLSTLWTVDDAASAQLTQTFLDNLKAGQTKDIALQQAKINFINSADPNKLHPFYWSSFKLTGSTKVFSESNQLNYLWLGLGVFVLLAGMYWLAKRRAA